MQSNNNNDKNTNRIINNREELLSNNQEILNNLILENNHKKDKSFVSIKELEFIREYESNLLKLLESCPPDLLKAVIQETSSLDEHEAFLTADESNRK